MFPTLDSHNGIETQEIDQAHRRSRLNAIHNSRLAINKIGPDILYIIFSLAINTPYSKITALEISQVCHHWRECTLQWPSLWAFFDLGNELSITELFMKRSRNAPLTLSWEADYMPRHLHTRTGNDSASYFESNAYSILSRLRYLNVTLGCTELELICNAIQSSKLPPLQLHRMAISIDDYDVAPFDDPLAMYFDNSCLQEIDICGLDLPWPKLPHHGLTRFTIEVRTPAPTIYELLDFLSSCPSLEYLEVRCRDYDPDGIETGLEPSTNLENFNRLGFSKLTGLELFAIGFSGYDYIRAFAMCIRPLVALSHFRLSYSVSKYPDESDESIQTIDRSGVPFEVLKTIPPEAFSNFSTYRYLALEENSGDDLIIKAHPSVIEQDYHRQHNLCQPQFMVAYRNYNSPVNYSHVLDLAYKMSHSVRYLAINYQVWKKAFALSSLNIARVFPYLYSFALIKCGTEGLYSIPADLRVEKLILGHCKISFDALYDVVMLTGAKFLDLYYCSNVDTHKDPNEVLSALRGLGVEIFQESRR